MKQRIILWLISLTLWLIFMMIATNLSAQSPARGDAPHVENRIDRFVDNESTIGRSKFTSVVERDPQTHEVVRVVKVRELTQGIDISKCLETFEAESKTGRFSHNIDGDHRHTLLIAVEGKHQDRIYMLQYTGRQPMQGRDGKVTIVIRMKNER